MSNNSCLLFLDTTPPDLNLIEYFNKFNIDIIQNPQLESLNHLQELPLAIFINWSLLKQNPAQLFGIYQKFNLPIIVIQDYKEDDVGITVLEAGADDVIVKPLNPREVHARFTAIHRRVSRVQKIKSNEKEVYLFANWRLYPASREIFNENREKLALSTGEYDLLFAFVQQPQKILEREFLLQITKQDSNPLDRRIDVQISRLRRKIESNHTQNLIKTIRNSGYVFTAPVLILKESQMT